MEERPPAKSSDSWTIALALFSLAYGVWHVILLRWFEEQPSVGGAMMEAAPWIELIFPFVIVVLGVGSWVAYRRLRDRLLKQCEQDARGRRQAEAALEKERARWTPLRSGCGITVVLDPNGTQVDEHGILRVGGLIVNGQPEPVFVDGIELLDANLDDTRVHNLPKKHTFRGKPQIPCDATRGFQLSLQLPLATDGYPRAAARLSGVALRLYVDCGGGVVMRDVFDREVWLRTGFDGKEPT